MEARNYWEENGSAIKYENYNSNDGFTRATGCSEQLNFAAAPSEDEGDYPPGHYLKKGKVSRQDPMSHRIIEKRRRDRMNNCLADLSRLIPPEYLKKGRGRVEKTEIIEMAIRHLKYLQERVNGLYHENKGNADAERAADAEHFRAGYHEAEAEAVCFLVEVQGYGAGDGLCLQLAAHLQRQRPLKGEPPREVHRSGNSSETSSSSSNGYAMKQGVIARTDGAPEPRYLEPYELPPEHVYAMDCDRTSENATTSAGDSGCGLSGEPLPLDAHKRETNLRTVRKPDHADDYLHSYKFKNCIERRFSRSQDCEAHDMTVRVANAQPQTAHAQAAKPMHKRRRAAKPCPSTSTSNSGSTEEARDTPPQDTSSESPHHHYDKPPAAHVVPVFALNTSGKYYVPVTVDYACLSRQLGALDALEGRTTHSSPLHPVTIHVNFQPCYRVKNEPNNLEWRAA